MYCMHVRPPEGRLTKLYIADMPQLLCSLPSGDVNLPACVRS